MQGVCITGDSCIIMCVEWYLFCMLLSHACGISTTHARACCFRHCGGGAAVERCVRWCTFKVRSVGLSDGAAWNWHSIAQQATKYCSCEHL